MIQIDNWLRKSLLGLFLLLSAATASAGLSGHYIKATHFYAPNGEIGSFEGLLGTELGGNLFDGWYSATVTDNNISIVWTAGKTLQGLFGFNGFVMSVLDGSPITSVSIAPSSTWTAFTSSRLTFDGSHVWADFGSLTSLPTQTLNLMVTTAIPESPTDAMLGLGLLVIAYIQRRAIRLGKLNTRQLRVDA